MHFNNFRLLLVVVMAIAAFIILYVISMIFFRDTYIAAVSGVCGALASTVIVLKS